MIEAIMLKLGFSGMIALALGATLIGGSVYTKLAISRRDAKIQSITMQVRQLAEEKMMLGNANRSLVLSLQKQNETIEGYLKAASIQQQRADRAVKEAQEVKARWESYTQEIDKEPDVQKAYNRIMARWNQPTP